MSNRSMLEFNHDLGPSFDGLREWAFKLHSYFRSGDARFLPRGVTYFGVRHHSSPCPLGEPPRGWNNENPPEDRALPAIPALLALLGEAHAIIKNERDGLLDSACAASPKTGKPLRRTLDEAYADCVAEMDDVLKRIKAVLP